MTRTGNRGRVVLVVLIGLAAGLSPGCDGTCCNLFGPKKSPEPVAASVVSVPELAQRLSLRIESLTETRAMLTRPGNSVLIYADPNAYVYVNGVEVARGGVFCQHGVLYVPSAVEGKVHRALRAASARPPSVAGRRPPVRPRPGISQPAKTVAFGQVVIDPGHGGKDPGARAVTGVWEKDIVLDVGKTVAQRLTAAGATVKMTRDDNTFIELKQRAYVSNQFGAKLFVSIHADAAPRAGAHGFTVYVARAASARSVLAAQLIARRLAATGQFSRGVQRANFKVLVGTHGPAVLVELGYLTNYTEAIKLGDPNFRNRMAQAVADGVIDFLGT